LHYNKKTGEWTWRFREEWSAPVNGRFCGKPAGTWNNGYLIITIEGRPYRAHVLAWLYVKGEWPDFTVDHKNRNPGDNRWSNLRRASYSQQTYNQKLRKDNSSGHTGVGYVARLSKWIAYIRVKEKTKRREGGSRGYLGLFTSKELAIRARKQAEVKFHGRFAKETIRANG
jgi:hypothetical protein